MNTQQPLRIALATCSQTHGFDRDDQPFEDQLRTHDAIVEHRVWDDASVDWSSFDVCVLRSTWDYMDRRDAFLEWALRVASSSMLINPLEVIRWNTHKHYLRELELRGVRTMPTVWIDRGQMCDVAEAMNQRGWLRGILKPAIGATARETLLFDADACGLAAAQKHLDRMTAAEDMLLQPFFESVQTTGEVTAVYIDGRFTHSLVKHPAPGDFRTQEDFDGVDEPLESSDADRELFNHVFRCADLDVLYARLDFLRSPQGELCLTELELVEPSLFFRHGPGAGERMADALMRRARQAIAAQRCTAGG